MNELSWNAPGSIACGRSGLPLLAICPNGHRRLIPFRLLKTSLGDQTPLYGRPFRCKECGSPEVTLFAIESQAELNMLRPELLPPVATVAPTNNRKRDPDADVP
jgi:hypothetical protein